MQERLFTNAHDGGWGQDDQLHVGECRPPVSDVFTDISNIITIQYEK